MFGRIRYDHLTAAQLSQQYDAWRGHVEAWQDYVNRHDQHGRSRAVRLGLRRCRRHIRRIEVTARRRGVRL